MTAKVVKRRAAFTPGEYLREELEARSWTQQDLARIIGRPLQMVNEIINGKKTITAQTAAELGQALGTSAEVWINLESAYQLSKAVPPDPGIAQRAKAISKRRFATA